MNDVGGTQKQQPQQSSATGAAVTPSSNRHTPQNALKATNGGIIGKEPKQKTTLRDYREKALIAIKNVEEITHLNKGHWLINHERADQYRRRKLPNYLLQRTDWDQPTYICQSPLSQVFVEKKEIEILVNLD